MKAFDNQRHALFRFLPPFALLSFVLGLVSFILHMIALASPSAADALQNTIAPVVRGVLGYLTAIFPFSLAEMLLLTLPLWLVLLIFLAKRCANRRDRVVRMIAYLLSVPILIYSLFVYTMAFGYAGSTIETKLSLNKDTPTKEELYETALWLTGEVQECLPQITFPETGSTQMPYSRKELDQKLLAAYEALSEQYDFIPVLSVGTKPVMLSIPMSYTHITGVYTFFTGEANVNVAFPDYSTAFTTAHEMAHMRGIARENEANFVAFLACIHGDDPYLRYAGYLNMLQYVGNALYRADKSLYQSLWKGYSDEIRQEMRAYNTFFARFENSTASHISEKVNNSYLQSVGTEGTVSYGLVVDLAVAYHQSLEE